MPLKEGRRPTLIWSFKMQVSLQEIISSPRLCTVQHCSDRYQPPVLGIAVEAVTMTIHVTEERILLEYFHISFGKISQKNSLSNRNLQFQHHSVSSTHYITYRNESQQFILLPSHSFIHHIHNLYHAILPPVVIR